MPADPATTADAPVVQTHDLTKRYGEHVALDSLTLQVDRGQILGFIGPNGAGKTTTIKILVGLAKPTEGHASIAGRDCTRDSRAVKRLVGYMPDTFGGYDHMRVREYLDFFGAAYGIPRKDRGRRIDECLDAAGASHMRDLFLEALSHGMKQRVALARTLVHDPPVLILDEPANGLDPQARIDMRTTLLDLARRGKTLIVTSHILPELGRVCDTVAILSRGKLRAFGTLDQIMQGLRQRRIMEVQLIDSAAVEPAAAALREALGEGATVHASPEEAQVRFEAALDDRQLAGVLKAVMVKGVRPAQFREVPLDLEDAFLSVAGEADSAV